jgi:hypothetical protein
MEILKKYWSCEKTALNYNEFLGMQFLKVWMNTRLSKIAYLT